MFLPICVLYRCGLAVRSVSLGAHTFLSSLAALLIELWMKAEHNAVVRGVVLLTENVSSIRRLWQREMNLLP